MSEPCWLYIFETVLTDEKDEHPTLIKVGITSNVDSRLSTVQTSYTRKLICRNSFKFPTRQTARGAELLVHSMLKHERQHGEWFSSDGVDALIAVVDAVLLMKLTGYPRLELEQIGITESLLNFALGIDGDFARAWRKKHS